MELDGRVLTGRSRVFLLVGSLAPFSSGSTIFAGGQLRLDSGAEFRFALPTLIARLGI
jgi:hypothetical protein